MILKNEGATIYSTLDSVKDITDEFIIGIDGSTTDGTEQEVLSFLEKYDKKSIVYPFKWNDDFSKARNDGFDKATSDYILIMDGHEKLIEQRISDIELDKDVYLFEIEMIHKPYRTRFEQARLFKKGLRMENKSHNVLKYDKAFKIMGTVIQHERDDELAGERAEQRKKMNLANLSESDDPRALAQYAHELFSFRMWYDAVEAYEKYLLMDMDDAEKYQIYIKLGTCYFYLENFSEASRAFKMCYSCNKDKRNAHVVFLAELFGWLRIPEIAGNYAKEALEYDRPKQFYHLFPDFYHDIPLKMVKKYDPYRSHDKSPALS